MQIAGPQTLTVGTPAVIDDPAQVGGNPSVACQIQNSSAYQLNVLAAGDVLSIQPFTAQTIEISGQPITVTAITGTGSGAATITFVFLLGVAPGTGVQLSDGTWVETPPQQDGPLTAAAITAANAPPGIVFPATPLTIPVSAFLTKSFLIPPTARTLVISGVTNAPLGNLQIEVQGNSSGFVYRAAAPPYLGNIAGSTGFQCIVAVSGVMDSSLTVTLFANSVGSIPLTLTVAADSVSYPEDVFYNGQAQEGSASRSTTGTSTIVTGPCRLLTLQTEALAGSVSEILLNGTTILRADASSGLSSVQGPLTFPPNTILPINQLAQMSVPVGGNAQAGIVFAYP